MHSQEIYAEPVQPDALSTRPAQKLHCAGQ